MTEPSHRIESLMTRVTLWLLVFFSVVAVTAIVLLMPQGPAATSVARMAVPGSVIVGAIVAFLLVRRGRLRLGIAIVNVATYVSIVTYVSIAGYGLHSYVIAFFALLIVVTALMIGHRAGIWTSIVTVATVIVMYALERQGLLTDPAAAVAIPLINILIVYCLLFSATGAVLFVYAKRFHEALQAADVQEQ